MIKAEKKKENSENPLKRTNKKKNHQYSRFLNHGCALGIKYLTSLTTLNLNFCLLVSKNYKFWTNSMNYLDDTVSSTGDVNHDVIVG